MSNNMNSSKKALDWISNINKLSFTDKSVLLIGAGKMGKVFADTLSKMGIKNVIVVTNTNVNSEIIQKNYGFKTLTGGFFKSLSKIPKQDLVIIATPTQLSVKAATLACQMGQDNILIEKPASINPNELLQLDKNFPHCHICVGYNRLLYPNFIKLKYLIESEGGITSCRFSMTEKIEGINFSNYDPAILQRWGIENSSHIISMVFELIGFPQDLFSMQKGNLPWHPSGSIFVGHGKSKRGIPFSYVADWTSAGNWEVEVFTQKNSYKLEPLEKLFAKSKNTFEWTNISFDVAYPETKFGIAEEIALMLTPKIESIICLPSLEIASTLNTIAEKIFGYTNS